MGSNKSQALGGLINHRGGRTTLNTLTSDLLSKGNIRRDIYIQCPAKHLLVERQLEYEAGTM